MTSEHDKKPTRFLTVGHLLSVREFGDYLEEIVKDYLRLVKDFPLADTQYPYVFKHSIKHPYRPGGRLRDFPSPSDVDVIGVAGKKLVLVSCKTNLQSYKEMEIEARKLRRARGLIGFRNHAATYVIVYAREPSGVLKSKGDIAVKARRLKVEVWFLSDIIRKLVDLVRKRSKTTSFGRYDWLLSWMIRFGLVRDV